MTNMQKRILCWATQLTTTGMCGIFHLHLLSSNYHNQSIFTGKESRFCHCVSTAWSPSERQGSVPSII